MPLADNNRRAVDASKGVRTTGIGTFRTTGRDSAESMIYVPDCGDLAFRHCKLPRLLKDPTCNGTSSQLYGNLPSDCGHRMHRVGKVLTPLRHFIIKVVVISIRE